MTAHSHKNTSPTGSVSRGLNSLLRGYQLYISPLFGPHCRYYPSCSEYARQAFIIHGPIKGGRLAVMRLLRCNPFSYGGVDPVPEQQCCSSPSTLPNSEPEQGS